MIAGLVEYARDQFALNKRQKDGSVLRDHLMAAYQATGILPQQLADARPLPELAAHVWDYFLQLHSERERNGMAVNSINSRGILDWCELSRIRLEHWEIRAIRAIDNEFVSSANDD